MNNETNTTNATATEEEEDPWALMGQLEESLAIPYGTAFILFITLGVTTLLSCLVISCRMHRRWNKCWPSSLSQIMSCLCVVFFWGMLAAGFFSLAAYSQEFKQVDDYTRFGEVRILDTRIVSDNTTFHGAETSGNESFYEGFVAQLRVTFGGTWGCGKEANDTFCDTYGTITECNRRICDAPLGNCTNEQRTDARTSAMECLANITGSYELPIDNSTFYPSIPPELDPNYPNFPLIGTSRFPRGGVTNA